MRPTTRSLAPATGVLALLLVLGAPARAQQPAAGTMKHDAATSGSSSAATEGFDAVKKVEPSKDALEAKIQAGALVATGNSRSLSVTSLGAFRVRRSLNEFSANAAANYAEAAASGASERQPSVENYQGKLRYDRFLSESVALFVSFSGRRDRFQGLDLRLNFDPGVAYYFIDGDATGLWAELGYDLQYDVRRDQNIRAAAAKAPPEIIDKTDTRHSGRAFAGFRHKLNDNVSLDSGLEFLLGLPETKYWRLNFDLGLNAALAESFSLASTFSLKYDNEPLSGLKKTDSLTAVSLVYTFL